MGVARDECHLFELMLGGPYPDVGIVAADHQQVAATQVGAKFLVLDGFPPGVRRLCTKISFGTIFCSVHCKNRRPVGHGRRSSSMSHGNSPVGRGSSAGSPRHPLPLTEPAAPSLGRPASPLIGSHYVDLAHWSN